MKYAYPAYFKPAEKGMYEVIFPDLENCYTCGENLEDALLMADDVLNLMLWSMEKDGLNIPKASRIEELKPEKDVIVSYVAADTLKYCKKMDTKSVKKTLSIPQWLDDMAKAHNINFSNVLQNALMKELGIESKI